MALSLKQKRYSTLLITLVVTLSAIEIVCRYIYPSGGNIRFTQSDEQIKNHKNFKSIATAMISDPELFWVLKPHITFKENSWPYKGVISNNMGFREVQNTSKRTSSQKRILFLGDSCTFGYGLNENETYVSLVENQLKNTECINAGVPGYSLFQGYKLLQTKGFELNPTTVILSFGWNDQNTWDNMSDIEHDAHHPPSYLSWSRFCHLIWSKKSDHKKQPKHRLSVDEYASIMKKINRECQQRGIDVKWIIWPFTYNIDPNKPPKIRGDWQIVQYLTAAKDSQIDLVVPLQEFAKDKKKDDIFFDVGHMTATGHQLVAQEILKALVP